QARSPRALLLDQADPVECEPAREQTQGAAADVIEIPRLEEAPIEVDLEGQVAGVGGGGCGCGGGYTKRVVGSSLRPLQVHPRTECIKSRLELIPFSDRADRIEALGRRADRARAREGLAQPDL